jgi:long-subunit fatty acid transport protein
METVWYHYDVKKIPIGISLLFTNIGMQSDKDHKDTCTFQQQLFGTYIDYHTKKLTAEAAFYYQTGKEEHGIPIDAWMASGKVTYKHNDDLTLYGGYDYLSGDKNFAVPAKGQMGMPQHKKVKGFSSIYGSHHKFYGAMDFFYLSNYYGGFTPGLQNIYLGTKYSPVKKLSIDLSYHYLLTATQLNNDVNKSLGHEVEAAVTYKLMKDASLSAGYSFMRGTDTMVALKRTNNNRQLQWAWIMLSVSPKLLSTIW